MIISQFSFQNNLALKGDRYCTSALNVGFKMHLIHGILKKNGMSRCRVVATGYNPKRNLHPPTESNPLFVLQEKSRHLTKSGRSSYARPKLNNEKVQTLNFF